MEQTVSAAIAESIEEGLQRMVLSNAPKTAELSKVKVHPVVIGKTQQYQIEEYRGNQVFHVNCGEEEVAKKTEQWLESGCFKQAELVSVFHQRLGFYTCTVPTYIQFVMAELISNGDFERHINRVRRKKRASSRSCED